MRFAARGKYKFMQMEVAMGILPCGGGASYGSPSRFGTRAWNYLGTRDFDADEAEAYGTINKALSRMNWGCGNLALYPQFRRPLML